MRRYSAAAPLASLNRFEMYINFKCHIHKAKIAAVALLNGAILRLVIYILPEALRLYSVVSVY